MCHKKDDILSISFHIFIVKIELQRNQKSFIENNQKNTIVLDFYKQVSLHMSHGRNTRTAGFLHSFDILIVKIGPHVAILLFQFLFSMHSLTRNTGAYLKKDWIINVLYSCTLLIIFNEGFLISLQFDFNNEDMKWNAKNIIFLMAHELLLYW